MKNLYLRDASVLISKSEIHYSNNLVRLKEAFKICSNCKLNVQITISKSHFLKNYNNIKNEILKNLNKVNAITIHLTTSYNDLFSYDNETRIFTKKFIGLMKKVRGKIVGICVHPDHVRSWKYLKKLKTNYNYLAIEVTDRKARYGNKISHLKSLIKEYKFLKIVADTSHIKELAENKMMNFEDFYIQFKDFIIEAQISDFGNYYKSEKIKTTHSLLHLNKDFKIKQQIEILKKIKNINLVIEGLLPYGKNRHTLLSKEMKYIKNI